MTRELRSKLRRNRARNRRSRYFVGHKPGWKNPSGQKGLHRTRFDAPVERDEDAGERLPSRDGEYWLAPCCVLFAAIVGTRAAYEWAMDALPLARGCDSRRRGGLL